MRSPLRKGSGNILDRQHIHDRNKRGSLERRNSSGDRLSVTPDNLSPSPASSPGLAVNHRQQGVFSYPYSILHTPFFILHSLYSIFYTPFFIPILNFSYPIPQLPSVAHQAESSSRPRGRGHHRRATEPPLTTPALCLSGNSRETNLAQRRRIER